MGQQNTSTLQSTEEDNSQDNTEKKNNKIERKNGLFIGGAMVGITLFLSATDAFTNRNVLISIVALLFVFSFLSIYQKRKFYGIGGFRDAFTAGFKTTVIGALALGIWMFIFLTFFGQEFLEGWMAREEASILTQVKELEGVQTFTEKQISEGIQNMKDHLKPRSLAIKLGFFTIILGAITSLVTTTINELIWMKNDKQ
ncbi:MAG: DUF4199 domain-containing protein [Flavobacteriales bacterium]